MKKRGELVVRNAEIVDSSSKEKKFNSAIVLSDLQPLKRFKIFKDIHNFSLKHPK